MNAVPSTPLQSNRRFQDTRLLSNTRSQAAFVRALLDEVERTLPAGMEAAVSEQLIEELARLGCRCLELSNALARAVDEANGPSRDEASVVILRKRDGSQLAR